MLLKSSSIFYRTKVSSLSLFLTLSIGLSTSVNATPAGVKLIPLPNSSANFKLQRNVGGQVVTPDSPTGKLVKSFKDLYKAQKNNQTNSLAAQPQQILPQNTNGNQASKQLHHSKNLQRSQQGISRKSITSNLRLKLDAKGTPRFFSGFNKQALSPSYKIRYTPDAYAIKMQNLNFFEQYQQLLKLDSPADELKVAKLSQDELGQYHTKYTQHYNGIPVWKGELITHSNQLGNVIGLTGKYIPTPSNISTTPMINADDAITIAISSVAPDADNNKIKASSQLVIYSDKDHIQPLLAWEVELNPSLIESFTVLIDAKSGKLLYSFNNIHSENVVGSGIDSQGKTRKLNVWKSSGKYYLHDTSKSMFADSGTDPMDFKGKKGVINIYDARNKPKSNKLKDFQYYYQLGSNSPNSGWVKDGVSAAYNFSQTYDYFKEKHNRNSLDGEGGSIKAIVQFGNNFANAFWHSGVKMMFFGTAIDFAGALDVVAHELSHGITNSESNLTGGYQTGAINEALSDIFGEAVERYSKGSNDWLMGKDSGYIIRNMKDPGAIKIRKINQPFPAKMSDYKKTDDDDGGVHWNSTIPSHAFYLLAEGGSYKIGMEQAVNIFYRANTTHLLPRSEFSDLRLACIQSADDIHGKDSTQSKAVASAFDAVEIYDTPTTPPTKPGTPSNVADSLIMLTIQNGKPYLGRFEKNEGDSGNGVFFKNTIVGNHRPAVSGSGTVAAYITDEHDLCLIGIQSGTLDCMEEKNQFFSVAFSPDDHFVSVILKDPNEHQGLPSVNIIDLIGDDTKTYKLKAAKVDDSTNNEITSADAMDFTANGRYLIYDAQNKISFNNNTVSVWSIYALDLQKGSTIAIVPPKPNAQVGYPNLSNINNNLIAFDIYDTDKEKNHVVTGDLSTGKLTSIATTGKYFSLPSLTGDDKSVVYSVHDDNMAVGSSIHITSASGGDSKVWIENATSGVVYRHGKLTAPASVDLQVKQTVKLTPNTNDSLTFNITLKNTGSNTATNVVLTNNFSVGLEAKDSLPSGCTKKGSTKVECSLKNLKPGATKTMSLVLRATKTGELSNSATIHGAEEDVDTNNNTHVLKFKVTKNGGGGSGGGDKGGSGGGSISWLLLLMLTLLLSFSKVARSPVLRKNYIVD